MSSALQDTRSAKSRVHRWKEKKIVPRTAKGNIYAEKRHITLGEAEDDLMSK